jgi:hypothetical protein
MAKATLLPVVEECREEDDIVEELLRRSEFLPGGAYGEIAVMLVYSFIPSVSYNAQGSVSRVPEG